MSENLEVYKKLNDARKMFHSLQLKKTGHNKFAGYDYFELGDFLIPALDCFYEVGLCAHIRFDAEMATMYVVDIETGGVIVFTSPMAKAELKGCHEIQNLGAVETYQRRYLWVMALEIVEHDALDATTGKDDQDVKPKKNVVSDDKKDAVLGIVELLMKNEEKLIREAMPKGVTKSQVMSRLTELVGYAGDIVKPGQTVYGKAVDLLTKARDNAN